MGGESEFDPAGTLPPEGLVRIHVQDGGTFVLSCTPLHLPTLATGWLICEGMVRDRMEIENLTVERPESGYAALVSLRLTSPATDRLASTVPEGGDVHAGAAAPYSSSEGDPVRRAPSALSAIRPLLEDRPTLASWFGDMFAEAPLRSAVGGMHTGALAVRGELACVVEDVSRHHVVDRLVGSAAIAGEAISSSILLLSSRISGAMASKACRAGVAALVSRSVPTDLAVSVARAGGVALVGRARREDPVYFWPEDASRR